MIEFRNENQNSAKNFNSVYINWVRFFFSYSTCVAVLLKEEFKWEYKFAMQNQRWWTTGKHLNWFWVDKKDRLEEQEFNIILDEAMRQVWLLTL